MSYDKSIDRNRRSAIEWGKNRKLMMPLTAKTLDADDIVLKIDSWGSNGGRRLYASVKNLSAVNVTKFVIASQWADNELQCRKDVLTALQFRLDQHVKIVEGMLL